MASRKINYCDKVLQDAWFKAEAEWEKKFPDGPNVILTCTYRSPDEQNKLYAVGRTVQGSKITNAKGGQSPHNFFPSLAFDISFVGIDKQLDWNMKHFEAFADIIKAIDGRVEWGGDWEKFKDAPHFQRRGWKGLV